MWYGDASVSRPGLWCGQGLFRLGRCGSKCQEGLAGEPQLGRRALQIAMVMTGTWDLRERRNLLDIEPSGLKILLLKKSNCVIRKKKLQCPTGCTLAIKLFLDLAVCPYLECWDLGTEDVLCYCRLHKLLGSDFSLICQDNGLLMAAGSLDLGVRYDCWGDSWSNKMAARLERVIIGRSDRTNKLPQHLELK